MGYRKWVFVGAPLTPNDMNDGEASFPEFHNTYMDPDSLRMSKRRVSTVDGTVLVKGTFGGRFKGAVQRKRATSKESSSAWRCQ